MRKQQNLFLIKIILNTGFIDNKIKILECKKTNGWMRFVSTM